MPPQPPPYHPPPPPMAPHFMHPATTLTHAFPPAQNLAVMQPGMEEMHRQYFGNPPQLTPTSLQLLLLTHEWTMWQPSNKTLSRIMHDSLFRVSSLDTGSNKSCSESFESFKFRVWVREGLELPSFVFRQHQTASDVSRQSLQAIEVPLEEFLPQISAHPQSSQYSFSFNDVERGEGDISREHQESLRLQQEDRRRLHNLQLLEAQQQEEERRRLHDLQILEVQQQQLQQQHEQMQREQQLYLQEMEHQVQLQRQLEQQQHLSQALNEFGRLSGEHYAEDEERRHQRTAEQNPGANDDPLPPPSGPPG
ncbi:hypothetical protein BKA83DRAFT_4486425 [Pisolithus microcarpus]|nr:hypothetical protein BKA83DRAFT_4486425 [Pisolithus microcarpus]